MKKPKMDNKNTKSFPTIFIESLKTENEMLNNEISDLKKNVEKFTEGKRNFYMLGQQISVFNKEGLGCIWAQTRKV